MNRVRYLRNPPKGGDFAIFSSKVSSCKNFQRQSSSYIVPLSNGVYIDGLRATSPSRPT